MVLFAAPGGESVASTPGPDRAHIGHVRIEHALQEYVLTASELDGLRRELENVMPEGMIGSHGRTISHIEVSYELEALDTGCRLASADIVLHVMTTLPVWRPEHNVSPTLRRRWEAMLDALARHEAAHAANAREAAEDFRSRLLALPPAESCRVLQRRAGVLLQRVTGKYQMKDNRYDARTRNGVLEGIVL